MCLSILKLTCQKLVDLKIGNLIGPPNLFHCFNMYHLTTWGLAECSCYLLVNCMFSVRELCSNTKIIGILSV